MEVDGGELIRVAARERRQQLFYRHVQIKAKQAAFISPREISILTPYCWPSRRIEDLSDVSSVSGG